MWDRQIAPVEIYNPVATFTCSFHSAKPHEGTHGLVLSNIAQ